MFDADFAISCWSTASGSAVSATSALVCSAQSARCCARRAAASEALARASAAVAGAVKPAAAVRSDSRAVSARLAASRMASAVCWPHTVRLKYCCATSAATDTRASCHSACAPDKRSCAADSARRPPPNRSISHAVCNCACAVVASGKFGWVRARLAPAVAVSPGNNTAVALACVRRAWAMRDCAAATLGLAACAASISAVSTGSLNCCHHCDSCGSVPPWASPGVAAGRGACQATGARGSTVAAGGFNAQPNSPSGASTTNSERMGWIFMGDGLTGSGEYVMSVK